MAGIHKQPTPRRNKNMGGWRYFPKPKVKDLAWNMHEVLIIKMYNKVKWRTGHDKMCLKNKLPCIFMT